MQQQLVQDIASLGLGERPGGHSTGPSHSNLYINNLPHDATEQQVEALFAAYGEVVSLRLVRASRMGASTKTFAFVKLGSMQQAQAAIQALNHTPCAGSLGTLEVKFADADAGDRNPELSAPPSDNLYCKNLPGSFTQDELLQLFSAHGTVVESKLLHRGDSTQGAGALVRMSNVQEARQAIQSLHNQRLPGSIAPLVVRFADSAEQKAKKATRMGRAYDRWAAAWAGGGSGGSGSGYAGGYGGHSGELRSLGSLGSDFGGYGGGGGLLRDRESSIYIKYLPDTADKLFLYEKFAPFGAVHSVKVMLDDVTGLCKGVGFVNYCDPDGAQRAVRAMNNMVVGDKRLHVAVQTPRGGQPQQQQQQQR